MGALDPFLDTDYGDLLSRADEMLANSEKTALPVEDVSNLILEIANNKRPKTRYIVHKNKFLFKIFSKYFPDRMVDKMVWKNLTKGGKSYRPI